MSDEFIEEHREEIETITRATTYDFDEVVEMLNRAMTAIKDVFDKLAEIVHGIVNAISDLLPDHWKEIHQQLAKSEFYKPRQKLPKPRGRIIFTM